jgi:hypothetical protein
LRDRMHHHEVERALRAARFRYDAGFCGHVRAV